MARARRSSSVLETARQRLAGLKSITPAPDFGTNLSLAGYEQEIDNFSNNLAAYNQQLAALDDQQNALEAGEDALRDKSKRMLSAAEAQFGSNSTQYEQAGGTRTDERKRTARKAPGDGSTNTRA
jgi:predicted  nucleic acid-binding Zn-ribbon protein